MNSALRLVIGPRTRAWSRLALLSKESVRTSYFRANIRLVFSVVCHFFFTKYWHALCLGNYHDTLYTRSERRASRSLWPPRGSTSRAPLDRHHHLVCKPQHFNPVLLAIAHGAAFAACSARSRVIQGCYWKRWLMSARRYAQLSLYLTCFYKTFIKCVDEGLELESDAYESESSN